MREEQVEFVVHTHHVQSDRITSRSRQCAAESSKPAYACQSAGSVRDGIEFVFATISNYARSDKNRITSIVSPHPIVEILCSDQILCLCEVRASGDLPLPTITVHGRHRRPPACQQPFACLASPYRSSHRVLVLHFVPLEPVVPGAIAVVSVRSLTCSASAPSACVLA